MDQLPVIFESLIWSAISAIGFAILFRVPRHLLLLCAFTGAAGYGLRTLSLLLGLNMILSSLVGATAVGFLGYSIARRQKMPTTILTVPGVIPLVPGSIAFQSLVAVISALDQGQQGSKELIFVAVFNGLTATLIFFSLGVGISAPFLLFRRQHPVV